MKSLFYTGKVQNNNLVGGLHLCHGSISKASPVLVLLSCEERNAPIYFENPPLIFYRLISLGLRLRHRLSTQFLCFPPLFPFLYPLFYGPSWKLSHNFLMALFKGHHPIPLLLLLLLRLLLSLQRPLSSSPFGEAPHPTLPALHSTGSGSTLNTAQAEQTTTLGSKQG